MEKIPTGQNNSQEAAARAEEATEQAERGVESLLKEETDISKTERDFILQFGTPEEKKRLLEKSEKQKPGA